MLAGHSIRVTYTSTILAVADRIFFLERSFIVGVDYDAKALIEQCYLDCKLDIRFMTTKALNFARQDKDTRQSLMPYPCSLFYFDIKFGEIIFKREEARVSSFFFEYNLSPNLISK